MQMTMYFGTHQLLRKALRVGWLVGFAIAVTASNISCWTELNTKAPVVGFDIGLSHGFVSSLSSQTSQSLTRITRTVSVVFPNGTVLDLARFEVECKTRARVLQRLRDSGRILVDYSSKTATGLSSAVDQVSVMSKSGRHLSLAQALFRSGTQEPGNEMPTPKTDIPEGFDMETLLLHLKLATEVYLQHSVVHITLSISSLFTPQDESDIRQALDAVSLHISSCGDVENAPIAATVATRFLQFSPDRDSIISLKECLLGPFSLEEVVAVEYTEEVFSFSIFQLYIGKQTLGDQKKRQFVAVRNMPVDPNIRHSRDEDIRFWNEVKIEVRKMALLATRLDDHTLRIVLHGPASLRPKVLSTLSAALGSFKPDESHPRAIRMILTPGESDAKRKQRRIAASDMGLSCILWDQESEHRVKDYEKDLLKMVYEAEDSRMDVKEGFIGSRGAAMMGLLDRCLPCEKKWDAQGIVWEKENERASTLWYPDDYRSN